MTKTKHAALTNNQSVAIVFGRGCGFGCKLLVIGFRMVPGVACCTKTTTRC